MAEVGDAFVSIVPTMKGAGRKIQADLDGELGAAGKKSGAKFGGAFKGAFTGALAGLAIGKIAGEAIAFLKDSVAEGREAQKVGAKTTAIIKATGGAANISARGVERLATAISNKAGVDDEVIQTGANLLLTFKKVRNEAGKGNDIFNRATQAAVDLSATGFGSIDSSSKMLGKALNDPVKGITALSRAGVTFTEQQKDQIKAMVQSGDVLGAQKVILGEVQAQVGGVAAASATSGEKLSVAFGNFKESIGTSLLPTIDTVNGKLTTFIGWLQKNPGVVKVFAVVIGVVLVGAFLALAVSVIAATWPFILLIAAIALVVVGLIYAYNHSETFRKALQGLAVIVLKLLSTLLNFQSKVAQGWAWMLEAISKVPGFGWAKGAAKAMQGIADKAKLAADKTGELADKLKKVPSTKKVDVKTPKLTGPLADVGKLGKNIKDLPPSKKAEVQVNSLKTPIQETGTLKRNIDSLSSKSITIRTNYVQSGTPPRKASGSIVSGATRIIAGEAGREAIVPLDRPLNMVDPSVRWLAAYAQGKTDLSGVRATSLSALGSGSVPSDSKRVGLTITNWADGTGYFSEIADGQIAAQGAFSSRLARAAR